MNSGGLLFPYYFYGVVLPQFDLIVSEGTRGFQNQLVPGLLVCIFSLIMCVIP